MESQNFSRLFEIRVLIVYTYELVMVYPTPQYRSVYTKRSSKDSLSTSLCFVHLPETRNGDNRTTTKCYLNKQKKKIIMPLQIHYYEPKTTRRL